MATASFEGEVEVEEVSWGAGTMRIVHILWGAGTSLYPRQARLLPFFFAFFKLFFKTFFYFFFFFFFLCLSFFCVFFLHCFGLAPFLPFFKKNLLLRFCAIAFGFFFEFSSHALVLMFLSFFCSCYLVSFLLFFEERSSCDSNPQ